MKPLIYDVGANHGLNLAYYLAKGFRVVAIEANPQLAEAMRQTYAAAIAAGDATILNVGVGRHRARLPFHVNHSNDVLSSFVAPPEAESRHWSTVEVAVQPLSELIREHGTPWFVKIDVEHFDHIVLEEMLLSDIRPFSISVEAHCVEVPCLLVAMGYTRFQLVNCQQIGRGPPRTIRTLDGRDLPFHFQPHSAGPFGDDLPGGWLGTEAALKQWLHRRATMGFGWFDLHADRTEAGAATAATAAAAASGRAQ